MKKRAVTEMKMAIRMKKTAASEWSGGVIVAGVVLLLLSEFAAYHVELTLYCFIVIKHESNAVPYTEVVDIAADEEDSKTKENASD